MSHFDDNELSRVLSLEDLNNDNCQGHIAATKQERQALSSRFGLHSLTILTADYTLSAHPRGIHAQFALYAELEQLCAASNEPFPTNISEQIAILFVEKWRSIEQGDEEDVALNPQDCDEILLKNGRFDLGEAIAQSLSLSIDDFAYGPQGPQAINELHQKYQSRSNAFASLSRLLEDGGKSSRE